MSIFVSVTKKAAFKMKRFLRYAAALVAIFACAQGRSFSQSVQSAREEIASDPDKAGYIFYMYRTSVPGHAPAPSGYTPVYISHYGRHGARNIDSNSEIDRLNKILTKSHDEGNLTAKGEEAFNRYTAIYPKLRYRGGDLTAKGVEQHKGIAQRMFKNYPEVFKGKSKKGEPGVRIEASSTTVPRVVMSMASFCEGLKECDPSLDINQVSANAEMRVLNPFTTYNPQVEETDAGHDNPSAAWRDVYNDFKEKTLDGRAFVGRIFKDPEKASKYGSPEDIMKLFFHQAAALQCTTLDENFWDFLTEDERYRLFEVTNYKFYLSKGPDLSVQKGRQWAFADVFLQDVIDKADEDMAGGVVKARLRFGHDITLMSALVLMDIDGYNKAASSPEEVADVWQSYKVPMASNMQFIFYKNKGGDTLVRVMYNEEDIAFPIPSDTAPYYKWDELRSYLEGRIAIAKDIIASTEAPSKRQ